MEKKSLKKSLTGIILSVTLLSTAYGGCPSREEASLILSRINQTPTVAVEVKPLPQFNCCQVKTETGDTFFISESRRWVIEGILLKVPQVVVKEEDRERLRERALFEVGKGEELIVLTNPLCRACRENREKLRELSKRFRLIFVPVGFEGEEFEAAVDSYCRKKGEAEFFKVTKPFKVCDEGKLKVWSSQSILKKYGITVTPTFILPDGRALIGIEELKKELQKGVASPSKEP